MPEGKEAAFEEAIGMLEDQLESKENDLKQIPILLIDAIKQVPDDLFDSVASSLKNLVDSASFRVLIHPIYRDDKYFYVYKEMYEGGTLTAYIADKKTTNTLEKRVDSLKQKNSVKHELL